MYIMHINILAPSRESPMKPRRGSDPDGFGAVALHGSQRPP